MAEPMVDDAGNVWLVDGFDANGQPINPRPAPQTAQGRVFSLPPNPKDVAQAARQSSADVRAAAADARAADAADRSAREWAATHNPDGSPKSKLGNKPMRQGDAEKLESQINAYSYLKNAINTFDDKYAGNTLTGGLENFAQRRVSSVGTPGQADWWANFKTIDNMIRNELFGASLTTGEKAAYQETTIDPSMDPAIVKQNLKRRADIARDVLSRRVNRLHKTFNPEEVEAALGEYSEDLLAGKAQQKADNEVPDPTTGADLKPPPHDNSPPELPPANGNLELPTGGSRIIRDPRVASMVDAMINAGAGEASINVALKRAGFPSINRADLMKAKLWMKENPGAKYYGSDPTREEALSPAQQALANPKVAPIAAGLAHYANNATAGLVGNLAGDDAQGNLDAAAALNPKSAMAGGVLGGITGMLGAEGAVAARSPAALARFAPRIADALYGGALGFNTAREGEGLQGAALGAGAGLAGGWLGQRAMSGTGRALRGVQDANVGYLRGQGVPLTVGQTLGGSGRIGATVKNVEDALTSVPGVSSIINARRTEGLQGFNEAAMRQAGAPADIPVTASGAQGMDQLRAGIGPAYDNALGGVAINTNDPAFGAALQDVVNAANAIPPVNGAREAAAAALDARIMGATDPATGIMPGRGFQEAYRGLGRTARERANGDYGYEVGQVMRQGQNTLADALDAQNPGALEAFRNANAVNRNANVIAQALDKAKNQGDELFTPAQINTADAMSAKRLEGPMASAAGDRPFFDLARAGQDVLPSRLPDSGTATRGLVGAGLIGGIGGAGVGSAFGDPSSGAQTGLGLTLLLAAGGSKPAQKAMVSLLADRPDLVRRAGEQVFGKSWLGRAAGGGALSSYAAGQ